MKKTLIKLAAILLTGGLCLIVFDMFTAYKSRLRIREMKTYCEGFDSGKFVGEMNVKYKNDD